jgi:hypothetical protein
METKEILELIEVCKERNEMDFLYEITKIVAESDSIGEDYHGYCNNYTKEYNFYEREIANPDSYCSYIKHAGIPIYKVYLEHIEKLIKLRGDVLKKWPVKTYIDPDNSNFKEIRKQIKGEIKEKLIS